MDVGVSDGNYGEMYPKANEMKNSGVPFIRANNIKGLKIVWDDMKYINVELHKVLQSGHLKKDDILVTTRGDIGMLAYVGREFDDANINAQICLLRCGDSISSRFLLNYLSSMIGQKQFKELQTGSALKQLPKGNLAKLKINLPQKKEQKKIAEFLGSVDEWIENLRVQKKSLDKYKKGMMQKIFSQEIRFKDINRKDFAEWEEKRLGNVCDIKKGKQLNRIGLSASEGHPVINGGITPSGYTDTFNTKGNTIAISEGGNSCGFVNFIKKDFWCGGHCYSLLNIPSDTTVLFLYQYLKLFEKKIMRLRVGSGLPNIQRKDIEKLKLKLPSLFEQQKITEFLSSIDNSIESKQQQIAQAEQWKKGLMQGLFV
jgi:type I restriction enzyme S subunit